MGHGGLERNIHQKFVKLRGKKTSFIGNASKGNGNPRPKKKKVHFGRPRLILITYHGLVFCELYLFRYVHYFVISQKQIIVAHAPDNCAVNFQ